MGYLREEPKAGMEAVWGGTSRGKRRDKGLVPGLYGPLDLTSASCPVLQNFVSNCVLGGEDSLFCIRRCIWSSDRQQLEPVVPVVPATKSDGGSLCRQDLQRDRGNGNPCALAVPAHRRRWNPGTGP